MVKTREEVLKGLETGNKVKRREDFLRVFVPRSFGPIMGNLPTTIREAL